MTEAEIAAIRNAAFEEAARVAENQHLFSWNSLVWAEAAMAMQKALGQRIRKLKSEV